jgi:riboflavin kinase/FMN adenylyltransferase
VSISSTKIRNALRDGEIKLANDYLGYNYLLSGTVIKGKSIGRTIGFPTANLQVPESYKLIPKNGVYVIQSLIENKLIYGMMNIGYNPTVKGETISIEIHFFDFDGDLYSKKIHVQILDRIRDEVKFESIDKLKEQLIEDKKIALKHIDLL